jgi:MFS family permease
MNRFSKSKKILAVCCTIHGVQDGLSAAIYVLLPILAQTFGLNYAHVGLLKGLKSLAQGALEIFSGFASDRFGDRPVLTFGLALSGAGYLLLSQAGGQNVVLLCFLLIGMGGAFQHSPSSKLVTHAFSARDRRGALGLYNSSGDAGKLVFTASLSLATALAISWQSVAFVFGLTTAICAVAVFAILRKLLAERQGEPAGGALAGLSGTVTGWGIVDRRDFSALLSVVFLDSMVQAGVLTFVAFAMIEKGFSTFAATMAAVIVLAGGMFGKAACGFLAQRIGIRSAFAAVQLGTAAGLVLVVAAPGWFAYSLLPFLGVVLQGSTSITYGSVNDLVHPSHTARGYSLIYASSSFASIAGPFGFGIVGDRFGIENAMLVMAAISVLAVPPCLLLRDERRPLKIDA